MTPRENPSISSVKAWIFPTLVSLVSLLIWNDVNEIKADVKSLMAQSNIDKTRIDNLERQLYNKTTKPPNSPTKDDIDYQQFVAVLPNTKMLKGKYYKTTTYDY
jgi:hypothetical protein